MNTVESWFHLKLSSWGGIFDLIILTGLLIALGFEAALLMQIRLLLHDFSKDKNGGQRRNDNSQPI